MQSENTTPSRQQLSDLIESIGVEENAEQEILKFLIDRASEKDPALGEVIRYCAIPRRFNAEIIGTLRQARDDRQANEELLSKVLGYSFVRTGPDGTYKYNDGTRQVLLDEWRTPEKREKFDELNQQLVGFYKDQYERIVRLEEDLSAAAPILPPARHVQVTSIFQKRLVAPLLEALYHKSLKSAEECYKYFERLYQDQEAIGRLIVCESLVIGARDCIERLPADTDKERWLKWLRYWKARLQQRIRQDSSAAEILTGLLPETEGDTTLKLWVLADLGAAYYEQSKLHEAGEMYRQVIELASTSGEDAYNLSNWYTRLAQLHWALEDLGQAEEGYRKAIAVAKGNNVRIEISAQVDLSGVLYDEGQWQEALNTIIEALHLSRTELPSDREGYRRVLDRLMNLLARREPRLLDTIFYEARALTDTSDPLAAPRFSRQYIGLLRQSGQLARADEQLQRLKAFVEEQNDRLFQIELQLEEALLLEEQGRFQDAIAAYDHLASISAQHESAAWYCAAAISNRGMNRAKIGLWSEAEADLLEAIRKWREMSHEKLEGFIHGALATAYRQQGRLSLAQESLNEAFRVLGNTQSPYLNDVYDEQAEVFKAQGRSEEARLQYQQALDRYGRLVQFKQAGRSLAYQATLAGERGDWDEAARCAAESAAQWSELAKANAYRPSSSAERADRANSEGVQAFFVTGEDRLKRINKAYELFKTACEHAPENFWYRLNLAYACAELELWSEASAAITRVLTDSPEWLRARMLYERLADYRTKEGEKIFKEGRYEEAAHCYRQSREQLEGHVEFARLAEVELRLGDSLLRFESLDQAQTEYERGLKRAELMPPESEGVLRFRAAFVGRLGFIEVLRSSLSAVLGHFRANTSLRVQMGTKDVVEDLVTLTSEFSDLIKTTSQYRTLGEALRTISADSAIDTAERQRLTSAQLELSQKRYRQTRSPSAEASRTSTASDLPVPTPIMLEADARLFPLDEATPEVNRMLQVDIPAMRQMILNNTGVNVPGVRIRSNDNFPEGLYVLALDEVPIVSGKVFAGEKFSHDADRSASHGIAGHTELNPADGTTGIWLAESSWKAAEEAGLELEDSYQFMIHHLGSMLDDHLENFLGVQEVDNMLQEWKGENEEDKRNLLQAAVPDSGSLVRFTQVLHHLVKEHVPIRNLLAILSSFAEANTPGAELIFVTEKVRLALRADLPVNKQSHKLIGLSPDFEALIAQWIHQQDNKRFLAVPVEQTRELMDALVKHIGDQAADHIAIIVSNSEVRPFVFRFVNANYPQMLVSAESELMYGTKLPEERIEFHA